MIEVKDKKLCCGCSACAQICPAQCISMRADEEGFEYPHVDESRCQHCSLCDSVCPMQNVRTPVRPIKVCASRNRDEAVMAESSSGGVFTPLAEKIIDDDGIVFGVAFDAQWNAVHTHTDSHEGLAAYRGAKYVQSSVECAYIEVQNFLKKGRTVLFSGTPCQVAGLRRFLRKDYHNLFLVEVLCHGVPGSKVWQRYLETRRKEFGGEAVTDIKFRDKKDGWRRYSMTISFEHGHAYSVFHKKDPYVQGFIRNRFLRPSCYECKCKNGRSGSDIVIADYWGIDKVIPGYADKRGMSMVLLNTAKGEDLFASVVSRIESVETPYVRRLLKNGGFAEHLRVPLDRDIFFKRLNAGTADDVFSYRPTLLERIKAFIHRLSRCSKVVRI